MSSESKKVLPLDKYGQRKFNEGLSISSGYNTFRGVDFVKDGRLHKVRFLFEFPIFYQIIRVFCEFSTSKAMRMQILLDYLFLFCP